MDSRIVNPDQILTTDVEKWSASLSNLYLNISKPCLDVFLFAKKLSESTGYEGPAIMLSWSLFAAVMIRLISPPFGKFVAIEQELEGKFRSCHSSILDSSEEIAFYKGNDWEEQRLNSSFNVFINK